MTALDWIYNVLMPAMTDYCHIATDYWYIVAGVILVAVLTRLPWPVKRPCLDHFPITSYTLPFSLGRLTTGVDNYRYDVYLSDIFCSCTKKLIRQVIEEKASAFRKKSGSRPKRPIFERDQFKTHYREVMLSAISRAKAEGEIQIDYIARTAITKMLIKEIETGYEKMLEELRSRIREKDLSRRTYVDDPVLMKAELFELQAQKWPIIRATGKIIFNYIEDVDQRDLNHTRQSNFGSDGELPQDLFINPFFYSGKTGDYFMMEVYDLILGQRMDDPDNPTRLRAVLRDCFYSMFYQGKVHTGTKAPEPADTNKKVDAWIKQASNAEILFDFSATRARERSLKKQKGPQKEVSALKQQAKEQYRMLMFFYNKLDALGIIKKISAAYEIRPICPKYCPPILPKFILQFMTDSANRKIIKDRLRSMEEATGTPFPIDPLRRCRKRVKRLRPIQKKEYLIRFFKGFFRYQRDCENYEFMKTAMDMIHLLKDEKQIKLSRVNHTLYEFLVPEELSSHEKPVINHTIIKADIRGSTDIVHEMKVKQLNPASYFSLNMFDPITEVLPEYDAFKVFIEGDAMILGIYEREETPQGWYGVARACGLALQILSIIKRYNLKNKKHGLPLLEIGVGITFSNTSPTLFFDGDLQIMISSAINIADRLSGCSKQVRQKLAAKDMVFSNHVFQSASDEDVAATSDDIFLRYNVNGIELHPTAFQKLSREIKLRQVALQIPNVQKEKFFTGTFPTTSGRHQRLIIREGTIARVRKADLSFLSNSNEKFYEICTHPQIYESFKKNNL